MGQEPLGFTVTIERYGTAETKWFGVRCDDLTTSAGGHATYTAIGNTIQERLQAAFPGVSMRLGHDRSILSVEAGTFQGWEALSRLNLYRVILEWEDLWVEISRGPNPREVLMRTNRSLHPGEMDALNVELHVIATLIDPMYGGSPLYSLVPIIGKPDVASGRLLHFLDAKLALRNNTA